MEKYNDDDQHEQTRFKERVIDLIDRRADEDRGVERNRVSQAFGKILREFCHRCPHAFGRVEGVGFGQLKDRDATCDIAIHLEELAVGLCAQFYPADVANASNLSAVGRVEIHDDVLELLNGREIAFYVDRELEIFTRFRGRHVDLARRHPGVLLLNGVDDIARHQRALQHHLGIEPDSHAVLPDAEDIHVRDAGETDQFVVQLKRGEIAQKERVVLIGRRRERDDLQDGGGLLLCHYALRLHGLRQLRQRGGNAVLHQHLREVEVGADLESDYERVMAVGCAGRLHVEHVLDAVDLLLDRERDGLDQRLRVRAGISRA